MDQLALGVDLGGSKIAYALVNANGQVLRHAIEPTIAEEGPDAIIQRVAARIDKFLTSAPCRVAGIGVGVAGMIDSRRGVVIQASNLHWHSEPFKEKLLKHLKLPGDMNLWVDKDTNAAALGEMYFGSGQGSTDMLYVSVGTGVGGGMILNGHLYHGTSEGAGDIGHLVLVDDGLLCGCGKRGCLETLASGPAIGRQATSRLDESATSSLQSLPRELVTAQAVVEAARLHDPLALQCLATAGKWLGIALAYYLDINNPDRVIIGGGVSLAGPLLLEPARRVIKERALPPNAEAVKILPARLAADSAVIGAACLVWHYLDQG